MLLNALCCHLLNKSALALHSCTYDMTYHICDLHLQMNKLYNILIFSFPKQYYCDTQGNLGDPGPMPLCI